MLKRICLVAFSLVLGLQLFAHGDEHNDLNKNITPYNDASDAIKGINSLHLNTSPAWVQFTTDHPGWGARFNRFSKMPHRAVGPPISYINGSGDVVAKSLNFIQNELAAYEIPSNELVVTRSYNDGKYINVDFKQIHNNREVLWSRMAFRYTQQHELIMFGADVHNAIPANLPSVLSEQEAIQAAESALTTTILNSTIAPAQKIIPLPTEEGNYVYKNVYEVITYTNNGHEPGQYLSYVDAVSGEILYRKNNVLHIGFTVDANLYPSNLFSPAQNLPLRHLKVVNGSQTLYTDANGFVNTSGASANPTLSLEGLYAKVVTGQNGTAVATYNTFVNTANSTITFPTATSNQPLIQHFTAYYHVNVVHDFMKSKLPTFVAMDNPLLTRVDRVDANCNAFYDGSSINFYTTANGCNALSMVNTVVYHEFGHGITNEFWAWQGQNFDNGGVGEGYSDMWSMSITNDPVVGRGFNVGQANSFIRRYDINPKVYPQDIQGQVHADGEIIAGAWWDTYQYWGSLDSLSALFAQSHFGVANGPNGTEGQVYFDILIDALQYDDNDNNINNGTPHFTFIVKGFADHGIYLLNNTKMLHNDAGAVNSGAPIPINGVAVADFPGFLGTAKVIYRQEGGTAVNSIAMTKNGNNYSVIFPSQTAGEIYEYYFEIEDLSGAYSVFSPQSAEFALSVSQRNIPHSLLIGYKVAWSELFDSGSNPAGWTIGAVPGDNATRGLWKVGTPIPSYTDQNDSTTIVQPKYDVTGPNLCAFTGNGSSATASVGQEDVDGGTTTLLSPSINIASYNQPVLSFHRWYSNSQGTNPGKDFWEAEITYNGTNWFDLDRTFIPDVSWRMATVKLVPSAGTDIQVRFKASDIAQGTQTGSLVEAAVDGVVIYELGETPLVLNDIKTLEPKIYPNPATSVINIMYPWNGKAQYEILNALGQVIESATVNAQQMKAITVNVSSYKNGMYYLRLNQNGQTKTEKITIMK